jgi:hypothetical protein
MLTVYEDDDATLVSDLAITSLEAGADSDTLELHVWNESGSDVENVLVRLLTEDPDTADVWLQSGIAPQDEQWGRIRIIGYDNTGDASWSVASTDWANLGSYAGLPVGTIPDGCAIYIELKMHPPAHAVVETYRWALVGEASVYSLPHPAPAADRGILHGIGDHGHSGIVSGCAVTASSPADDEVHSAAGFWVYAGRLYGKITTDHQLDQDDGDSATLGSGESYRAVLTLSDAGVTVTKGSKGVSPADPTPPAGEIVLDWVTVEYQAGGTSVIETADIDAATLYDRYLCVDGGGLVATIHPGQAIGGGTWRFRANTASVTVTDDDDTYLWLLASGLWDTSADEDDPPETTALGPYWMVTAASGSISSITDLRTYAGETVVLHLKGDLPGSPGTIVDQLVEHERLFVEQLVYRLSDNGGGTSGSTDLDVELDGTTLYTSNATEDLRPSFAYDAADLIDSDGVHEVTELRKGQVVELLSTAHPDVVPTWAEVYIICRKP